MAVSERMCIVTRAKKPKSELIRLVSLDGKIIVDHRQKLQARGVWVSKDPAILDKLIKSKALNRAFKREVSPETYEELKRSIVGE